MGRNQRYYYAVQKGKQQGVFSTWDECKSNVNGYSGAKYKKFDTLEQAEAFANQSSSSSSSSSSNINNCSYAPPPSRYSPPPSRYSPPPSRYSPPPSTDFRHSAAAPSHRPLSITPTTFSSASRSTSNYGYYSAVAAAAKTDTTPPIKRKRSFDNVYQRSMVTANKVPKTEPTAASSSSSDGCVVYTDGASRGNGYKGARAGYGVWWGDGDARNTSAALEGVKQTNQRAEATAILKVLEQTQHMPDRLEIRTDSQYCIKAMTEWHHSWREKDWHSSTGKPVENRDLFEPMLNLVNSRQGKTAFVYVPGHKGIYGNEQADALAVAGADSHVVSKKKKNSK